MKKFNSLTFIGAALICIGSGMVPAKASLLQLSHDPLFLNQTVPPAIAVTLDDSGSMAWGYMFRGRFTDWNQFADPTFNRIYYNPNITYTPPIKADGSQMPNIDYTNAPVNGYHLYGHGKWFSRNLTNNFRPLYTMYYYSDNTMGGSWAREITAATNNGEGTRAFYLKNNNGTYTEVQLTDATELTNFANWYSYYSTRMKLARASISRAFAGFGPSFKIDWQALHSDTNLNNLSKFENTHRSNFYEWLFKAPTSGGTPLRNAFKRAGQLFEEDSSYDSDDFNTKLSCQQNFHIAVSDGEWNGGFSNPAGFTNDNTSLGTLPGDTGTTALAGAKYSGYNGADQQKIYPYTSDGNSLADVAFHYWANDLRPGLNNNVKRYKKDFTDASGTGITVPTGDDEWDVPAFVWNPKNNPAYWQHVVTYNVGLGLEATRVEDQIDGGASCVLNSLSDPKEAVYRALRLGNCDWPSSKIDDVWHASVNSRGDFFSANDPNELIKALNDVVNDILERLSRGSTSTVSSGVITNDTIAFSPRFDSSKWSGNLIAREANPDGTFGDALWDAACKLTGGFCSATGDIVTKQSMRNIYTYESSLGKRKFDTSLPAALKSKLLLNGNEVLTRTGANVNDLIEYVNGNQDKEISKGGTLRNRSSILADIVHASPLVVRGPGENYDDLDWPEGTVEHKAFLNGNGYIDFQQAKKNRHNVLYVGSNSGMLHAFDAMNQVETEEYWGFMPSKAFNNIHRLIDPQFKHWSYVDNTPVIRDAFFSNNWHTTLVSGMRYGGQAYFGLDITDGPSDSPDVMWEFTDEDDPDMGYTYGQATIVRVGSTGDWVALLPNGYNNAQTYTDAPSDPDDNQVSATGNAVMFVVRLSDGQLLAKLDTGVGSVDTPNGLATAIAVDSEFSLRTGNLGIDIDNGADFAYAGDLYGNLWRFDFSSDNYSDWQSNVKRIIKADNIKYRSITTQPRVVDIPNGPQSKVRDVMVIFGTGKYIEIPDRSINLPDDQYMVGVIDGLDSSRENLDIDDPLFVEQTYTVSGGIRNLSDNLIDLYNDYGWKVELPEQGERLANPITLLGTELLLASTTITAGIDPCEAGGRSWLSAFNPLTGGTTDFGEIFEDTVVGIDINGDPITTVVTGDSILINDLIIGRPPIVDIPGAKQIIVEGSENTEIITLQTYTWRRRNWTNLLTE